MRFRRFWQHTDERHDGPDWSRSWRDSGLADEVEAYLFGRTVDFLAAHRRPVPAWAALNRLTHGDRADLVRIVEGADPVDPAIHPAAADRPWGSAERFVAAHLLALAVNPDDLRRIQLTMLVPLEIQLIERTRTERVTTDRVLELAAEAVDSFHGQR